MNNKNKLNNQHDGPYWKIHILFQVILGLATDLVPIRLRAQIIGLASTSHPLAHSMQILVNRHSQSASDKYRDHSDH